MALILRYCILSQKKRFTQDFLLFHHTYVNSNNTKLGSILHTKRFSTNHFLYTENDKEQRIINTGSFSPCREDDKEHIYKGSLTTRIRNLKLFSYTTSFVSAFTQFMIYTKVMENENLASAGIVFAFLNLTFICSPLVVHWLTKRYVTDIYYYPKEDVYVAEVYNIFFKKKQIIFTSDEVDIPEIGGMFKSCTVHGHPLLFSETEFTDPKYYCVIMKYNEPIDFEMGPDVTDTQNLSIESTHEKLKDGEKDYKQIESK